MKMIIVLDKICLVGVITVSFYVGYKAGIISQTVKEVTKTVDGVN